MTEVEVEDLIERPHSKGEEEDAEAVLRIVPDMGELEVQRALFELTECVEDTHK